LELKAYDKAIADFNAAILLDPGEYYFKKRLQDAQDAQAGKNKSGRLAGGFEFSLDDYGVTITGYKVMRPW
jgi:hypothetical protein